MNKPNETRKRTVQRNNLHNKPKYYTLERCGHCDQEVRIPDNQISLCPACNQEYICPCSACPEPCHAIQKAIKGKKIGPCYFDKALPKHKLPKKFWKWIPKN